MKAPEVVPISIPLNKGEYKTRLYKAEHRRGVSSDFDEVIVLAPGWLGSGTLHFAASALARQGHDVAVVSHGRTSLFSHNQDRSKHVHFAARAATQATHKRGVIMIGHSNGNQDVHHAAEAALKHQAEHPNDNSLYRIKAIGSVAGAGLSGRHINMPELRQEVFGFVREFVNHPRTELDIVARSLVNFCAHPVLSVAEGFGASRCDVRQQASTVINTNSLRSYVETYLDNDTVIPLPEDRADYTILPGTHITPIICEDTVVHIAEQLYTGNSPTTLQLARFDRKAA
jgi:pimeloyl-ACP methyl ester carboxylesterase